MLTAIDTTGYSKPTAWCGPSALAALTGTPLVTATEMLTRIHGTVYDDLSGVWPEDVVLGLHELGYRAKPVDIIGRYPRLTHGPTLERFLSERRPEEVVNPMLIHISGHLLASHYGYLIDNWVMKPVPISDFFRKRRLVKAAYIVTKGT